MKKFSPKAIAYYALLIALNVILTRVASIRIGTGGTESIRIGFGDFPVILAGILFGPLAGGIVGAAGDLVGMIISPYGGYMPQFTLTAALTGIIPGLLMRNCKDISCKTSLLRLILAIGASEIITDILLVPYFLKILYGQPYLINIPPRIISQAVTIPLYAYTARIIIHRICTALKIC